MHRLVQILAEPSLGLKESLVCFFILLTELEDAAFGIFSQDTVEFPKFLVDALHQLLGFRDLLLLVGLLCQNLLVGQQQLGVSFLKSFQLLSETFFLI